MEQVGDLLLVHGQRDHLHVGFHDLGQAHRAARAERPAERDEADRVVLRVDDVEVVEVVGQVLGRAHVVDGLAQRPGRGNHHHLALHDAPGRVLRVGQALLEDVAVGLGQRGQDAVLELLVQVLEDLDRVVAVERREQARQALRPELIDHLLAHRGVDVGQHLRVEGLAQDLDQLAPLVMGQALQEVGQVGLVEFGDERPRHLVAAGLERVFDPVDQLGGKTVVLLRLDHRRLDVVRRARQLGHFSPPPRPRRRGPARPRPQWPTC